MTSIPILTDEQRMTENKRIAQWLGYEVRGRGAAWRLYQNGKEVSNFVFISEQDAGDSKDFRHSDTAALECDDKLHAEGCYTELARARPYEKSQSISDFGMEFLYPPEFRYAIIQPGCEGAIFSDGLTRAAAITGAATYANSNTR